MSELFLTPDELLALTDRQRPAAQMRWLKGNGYKFEIGANGHPKVLRTALEEKLGEKLPKRWRPDWSTV